MNEREIKQHTGLLGDTAGGQIAQAQFDAQATYRRTQAIQIALQARIGAAPYPIADLLKDADTIVAWLEPKPAISN